MATRTLQVQIVGDSASLERAFRRSGSASKGFGRDVESASRGALAATLSFRGLGRALTFAGAPFLAAGGAVAGLKAASAAASSLAEQTSKTQVVFGNAAATVEDFARNALGLANDQALQVAATFGALLRPVGLLPDEVARLSVQMSKLGVDLASFSNTPVDDALAAIRSGLVGESEPLRRYGILLSEAAVQHEALRETGKTAAAALTNQEKVLARLALIQKGALATGAVGDYARTIGGLANQQRELSKNVRNLEIAIGSALNPAILDVTESLNKWLGDSENQAKLQRDLTAAVRGGVTVVKDVAAAAKLAADALGGWKNAAEILIGLKVASIVARWTREVTLFSGAAKTAAGAEAVGGLVSAVRNMARIGTLSLAFRFPGLADGLSRAAALLGNVGSLRALGLTVVAIEVVTTITRKLGIPSATDIDLSGSKDLGSKILKTLIGTDDPLGDFKNKSKLGKLLGLDKPIDTTVGEKALAEALLGKDGKGPFSALANVLQDAAKNAAANAADAGDAPKKMLGAAQKIAVAIEQARTAVARGAQGAQQDLVAALRARVAFDRKYEKIQQDLIRRGVGDVKQHAKILKQLLADEASALSEIAAIQKDGADAAKQAAAAAKQAADDAKQARITALQTVQDFAQNALDTAQTTRGIRDDLRAFGQLETALKARIAIEGRTADLLRQLREVRTQRTQTRQFAALGLDPLGNEFAPTVANLKRELGSVTTAIEGSFLDTGKTQGMLQRIRTVLTGGLGNLTDDVRRKIKEMLDGVNDELKSGSSRVAHTSTTTLSPAVLAGLDLPRDQLRILRARLSRFNSAGQAFAPTVGTRAAFGFAVPAGPVVVESHVNLNVDGKQITTVVTRGQQRNARRNPGQRRGQNPL